MPTPPKRSRYLASRAAALARTAAERRFVHGKLASNPTRCTHRERTPSETIIGRRCVRPHGHPGDHRYSGG